jgi:hypothetical protein
MLDPEEEKEKPIVWLARRCSPHYEGDEEREQMTNVQFAIGLVVIPALVVGAGVLLRGCVACSSQSSVFQINGPNASLLTIS